MKQQARWTQMFSSNLFDETTFYKRFKNDLNNCKGEVIIESPFITTNRSLDFIPIFEKLVFKGTKIFVVTKLPKKHTSEMMEQSERIIQHFEYIGVQVFVTTNDHHRKLAILDRNILWEGSLNILSQNNSREIMRRIEGNTYAQEMFSFLKLGRFIK